MKTHLRWTQYLVGLSTFGVSLYLITTEGVTDRLHAIVHGTLLGVSIMILPGVFEPFYRRAKAGIGLYKEWRKPAP